MSASIRRAAEYAKAAHESIGQRRKFTNKPYIVHPLAVAEIVSSVTDDKEMICAAWLHDVVEDTPRTIEQVADEFGTPIATLVDELTNIATNSHGNRAKRAEANRAHTAEISHRAKTIKLADVIDNLTGIVNNKTGDVDAEFARRFVSEKALLLTVLSEGEPRLYDRATDLINRCKVLLKI
jgi:(p)ppGpp synthase/HD superfamily hydrolase